MRPGGLAELASGVDALYLSGRAQVPVARVSDLEAARAEAVELERPTPVVLAGEAFGVEPRAFGMYRYRLIHPFGLVGLTTSEHIPALRVQPRSEFLHGSGPEEVLRFFDAVATELVGGPVSWGLSRLDLFCDVQGWSLVGDERHRFVCRAKALTTHEEDGTFTGFEFGRRGTKTVCARIYDKSHQVERQGLDWWPTVWGERYDPEIQVLRVEFEFGRQGLREFGVHSPTSGLEAAPALWASVTEKWLTHRDQIADATKSRWPVSYWWEGVQRIALRSDAVGFERVRAGRRRGELRKVTPPLVGYLASAGAILGTTSLDSTLGAVRTLVVADEGRRGVPFDLRLADRAAERAYQ